MQEGRCVLSGGGTLSTPALFAIHWGEQKKAAAWTMLHGSTRVQMYCMLEMGSYVIVLERDAAM